MNLKLETEFSKAPILQEVDALKKQIDDMRPLPADVEGRVMQKLRLDWNYNSNAIEGNKLSYGETVAFLMEGITAKGKPLKDHLDIRGHNEAINFLLDVVKDTRSISEADIRALHKMILVEPYDVKAQTADGQPTTKRINLGEYKTSANHVQTATGETHYYATPEETPAKMQDLMEWYTEVTADPEIHPVVAAALFHHKFVSIHPFDDGNGRLSRILMNLILMQKGYPPVVVKMDDRRNYYSLLSRADAGENWPFIEYITEKTQNSLQLYLRAINGGDIDEDDDIDKEIAMFKMQVSVDAIVKEILSTAILNDLLTTSIAQLVDKINSKAQQFSELFLNTTSLVRFYIDSKGFFKYASIGEFFKVVPYGTRELSLNQLKSLMVLCEFYEFRNAENAFSLKVSIRVEFEKYVYTFFNINNEVILKKMYHEKLSPKDENIIIRNFINDLKFMINENLKSPKS